LRLSNDMSDDGIVQAFTEAITTMNTAMNNISYKTDEDEETVITSHAHFETSRLNEYTLDDESSEKKAEIENLITEVEQLLASDNVTQEQIDTVTMNLQEEIKQIKEPEVTVDKTGLEQALENAKKADTENKTEESVVNLE